MPGGVGPVNYPPCLYDTSLDTVTALPATYTGANFQCNNGHIYPNILASVHNQSWCGLTWSPIKYTYSGTACPLNSTKTSSDSVTAVTNPGSQVANGGSAVIGGINNSPSNWTDKGFWNDSSVRTLPNSIGFFTSTKDCIDTAIKAGYTRVGLQAGGQCWAGNQSNDYAKYMAASGCTRDLGCDWVNHVFINDDGATMSVGGINNSPSNWTDNYRNGQIVALNTKCPSLSVATIQGYDNAKIASTLTGSCPFTATQLAGTIGYPPFSDGSCNPGLELNSSNNTCQDIPYDYSN